MGRWEGWLIAGEKVGGGWKMRKQVAGPGKKDRKWEDGKVSEFIDT